MAASDEVNLIDSKTVVPLNTWVLISTFKLSYNLLRRSDGTFNRHLAEYLDRKVTANANPEDGVFSFDVVIDRATSLLSRVYRPAYADQEGGPVSVLDLEKPLDNEIVPVILFFHGGSFAHSSSNSKIYDTLCRRLVGACSCVVVSVNYRRAPESPYPCAYDDGWTALNWVNTRTWLKSKKDSKVRIFLAGDSSGGNIVHNVALKAGEAGIDVLGNVLLNPMFGGEERTESEKRLDGKYFVTVRDRDWYWKAFLPEGEDREHPACNPFGARARSLRGLRFPKSLVVVAGLDLIQDWQLAYAEGLERAGKEVKLVHLEKATIGFYLLPNNSYFHSVMDEIAAFVNAESWVGAIIRIRRSERLKILFTLHPLSRVVVSPGGDVEARGVLDCSAMSLDATVLEERRRRVRDRVRRHRQRKKLREEGLPEDEIARQLTAMESFRPPTNTVRRRRQPRPATDHTLVADGDLGMSQYLVPAFLSPAQNMPIPGCESMGYEMAFNTFANEMAADGLIAGGCVDFEYIDSLAWDPSQFGAILRNLRLGDISGNFRKHSADGQQLMALPSDIMGEIVPDAGRQTFLSAVDSLKCISEGR